MDCPAWMDKELGQSIKYRGHACGAFQFQMTANFLLKGTSDKYLSVSS